MLQIGDSLDIAMNGLSFVAGSALGWYLQRRSGAAAEADLHRLVGELGQEGVRSFAGEDRQALTIAANTLAILQHYRTVDSKQRSALTETIRRAHTNLAFGTLARAGELSNRIYDDLQRGIQDVTDELDRRSRRGNRELASLAEHVQFVGQVGRAARSNCGPKLPTGGISLDLWVSRECRTQPGRSSSASSHPLPGRTMSTAERLRRLAELYAEELTVIKTWKLLDQHSSDLEVTATIVDIGETSSWFAPWYLSPDKTSGRLCAVNVTNEALGPNDPGRGYEIEALSGIPIYPTPVQHGNLPPLMRAESIARLRRLIEQQSTSIVCVLAYDAIAADGTTRTLVLDGNHRLAAARQLIEAHSRRTESADSSKGCVLVFQISERRPVGASESVRETIRGNDWEWWGFTPDVTLIRGDQHRPNQSRVKEGNQSRKNKWHLR